MGFLVQSVIRAWLHAASTLSELLTNLIGGSPSDGEALVYNSGEWTPTPLGIPVSITSGPTTVADNASTSISHSAYSVPFVGCSVFSVGGGSYSSEFSASWESSNTPDNNPSTITRYNGVAVSGGYMDFDGINDYIDVDPNASFDPGTGNFTIGFSLRVDEARSTNQHVFSYQSTSGSEGATPYEIAVLITNGGHVRFCVHQFSDFYDTAGTQSTGTTAYYSITRNGSNIYVHKDGVLVASGTSSSNLGSGRRLRFGCAFTAAAECANIGLRWFYFDSNTARYTSSNYTPPTGPETASSTTYTLLTPNVDYTAVMEGTSTSITNKTGSSKSLITKLTFAS